MNTFQCGLRGLILLLLLSPLTGFTQGRPGTGGGLSSYQGTGGIVVSTNAGRIVIDGSGVPGGSATNAQPPSTVLSNLAANTYTGYTNAPASSTSAGRAMTNLLWGNTLFLDTVNGTNATAIRGDAAKPYKTATNALAALLSGDTLVVRPGVYPVLPTDSSLTASLFITNRTNVTIRGEAGSVFELSYLAGDEGLGYYGNGMQLYNCTNLMIDGVTFSGKRISTNVLQGYAVRLQGCDRVTFLNCRFLDWINQGVTDLSISSSNRNITWIGCEFSRIGGTNSIESGADGAAISLSGTNIIIDGCFFNQCFRNYETCCNADTRQVIYRNNISIGCYETDILLIATNQSDVFITENFSLGYPSGAFPAALTGVFPVWLKMEQGSNIVASGNHVEGYFAGVSLANKANQKIQEITLGPNNEFYNITNVPIGTLTAIGTSKLSRLTIKGNKFKNGLQQAISLLDGNDIVIEDNDFWDFNVVAAGRGYIEVGFPTVTTNMTNFIIVGNRFTSTAPSAEAAIVLRATSIGASVWGNEQKNLAALVTDGGTGTRAMPVNVLGAGMLYSDGSRLRSVTAGTGTAFDTNTGILTATGGGGVATNAIAIQSGAGNLTTITNGTNIGPLTIAGVTAIGALELISTNNAGRLIITINTNLFGGTNTLAFSITNPVAGQALKISSVATSGGNTIIVLTNDTGAGTPAGSNFEVQYNGAGALAASPNFRFLPSGFQLQVKNATTSGEVDINGEGFISQATGGQGLAFGLGGQTNILINNPGWVTVRPAPGGATNLFQVEYTNQVPVVSVSSNGTLQATVGINLGPSSSSTNYGTQYMSNTFPQLVQMSYSATASASGQLLQQRYLGNATTPTAVTSGITLGHWEMSGYGATVLQSGFYIESDANGTFTDSAAPTLTVFAIGQPNSGSQKLLVGMTATAITNNADVFNNSNLTVAASVGIGGAPVSGGASGQPSLTLYGTNSAGTATTWRMRNTNSTLVLDSPTAPTAVAPLTLDTNGFITAAGGNFTVGSAGATVVGSLSSAGSVLAGSTSFIGLTTRTRMYSSVDGKMDFLIAAANQYSQIAVSNVATYATNWTADAASFVGFTNASSYTQVWNVRGTSGNIVFWNKTGNGGSTAAGRAIWTNTIVASGSDIVVGVNCGIAIDTGVAVVGGGRSF